MIDEKVKCIDNGQRLVELLDVRSALIVDQGARVILSFKLHQIDLLWIC